MIRLGLYEALMPNKCLACFRKLSAPFLPLEAVWCASRKQSIYCCKQYQHQHLILATDKTTHLSIYVSLCVCYTLIIFSALHCCQTAISFWEYVPLSTKHLYSYARPQPYLKFYGISGMIDRPTWTDSLVISVG